MHDLGGIDIPARKFLRLLDYLHTIGLDADEIARRVGLDHGQLKKSSSDWLLPAHTYSRLYMEAVIDMQTLDKPLPWAAGIGSDFFEMMCHYAIGGSNLGAVLQRAAKFEQRVYSLSGHRVSLSSDDEFAYLHYELDLQSVDDVLLPTWWDRAESFEAVAKASGLLVWHAFCGWLIGRSIAATRVSISAPPVSDAYAVGLQQAMGCPVTFSASENVLVFPRSVLDYRLVHTIDSLSEFLANTVYQLILIERKPASTSAAIRSLVGIDFKEGMPSFADIAHRLHLSASSLRRRLMIENTSYQILKDELRCASAVDYLVNSTIKISDLSDLLGYTEPSSFVRSFRGWKGATPKTYRQQHQSKLVEDKRA